MRNEHLYERLHIMGALVLKGDEQVIAKLDEMARAERDGAWTDAYIEYRQEAHDLTVELSDGEQDGVLMFDDEALVKVEKMMVDLLAKHRETVDDQIEREQRLRDYMDQEVEESLVKKLEEYGED